MFAPRFIFATGIENSNPTIEHGRIRRDQLAECGHYRRWREDFELVRQMGIRHLRYGVPLHVVYLGPDRYDWSFSDAAFGELQKLGVEPIADLCHFGVPDWIGNFQNPDFPELFSAYAEAFVQRYPWVRLYTPVNEIHTCATFSGLHGWWNEQLRSDQGYVIALKHLARANVLAMHAILRHRPDAVFIQSESSEYFHAGEPEAMGHAERLNARRFLSLDLSFGHRLDADMYEYVLDNGMTRDEYLFFMQNSVRSHCVTGTDYYRANEHHVRPDGSISSSSEIYGYAMIAREYYVRYRLPMMYTETNVDQGPGGEESVQWLCNEWAQVLGCARDDTPVLGFTWYSLIDQVDWDIQLREQRGTVNPRGLFDLDRKIRPVGQAYQELIACWEPHLVLRGGALNLNVPGP